MESEENYEVVQTCGICEEICNQEDIENHGCLQGYPYYNVDPNTLYFYPLTENNTIVRRSEINNTEQLVEESFNHEHRNNILPLQKTEKRKVFRQLENTAKKHTKLNENTVNRLNFDDEEVIISEVQKRPPLWDYVSVPLVQRKHNIKQKLWAEISLELNGKVSAEEVQKKFKSLYDTYRKIIQSEQRPSGSARKDTRKWSHYESMSFLRDYCLSKSTVSNINTEDNLVLNSSPIIIDDDTENIPTDMGGKKKKINNNASTAMERIADAICKERNIVLPPQPELDEIESFLALLGFRLRKMPPQTMLKTMQRILVLTYEELMQNL